MKKRAGVGFALSALFPLAALAVVMLHAFDEHSRVAGFVLYGAGWVALFFALKRHERSLVHVQRGRRFAQGIWRDYWRPGLWVLAFLGCGAVLLTLVPVKRIEFVGVPPEVLSERIAQDAESLSRVGPGLLAVVRDNRAAFTAGADALEPEHKADLLAAWSSYLDYAVALDQLVEVHKYFYQINPVSSRELNARSFLIGYSALVSQVRAAAEVYAAVGNHPTVEKILDEARPDIGVPAGAYQTIKAQLTDAKTMLRLNAGRAHLTLLTSTGRLASPSERAEVARVEEGYRGIWDVLGKRSGLFVDNPLDYLEGKAFRAWFPLQKGVAEGMGMIRTTRRDYFVTEQQLHEILPELEPGDILLERRNWYLSNVGLPGFWPHAALYVGTPQEMDEYFGEAERAVTSERAPSRYLAEEYSDLLTAFSDTDDGHPPRIIEAIGKGVSLTSLEHSGHADYLAVLRPRLTKGQKLGALTRAFAMYGRPYDFNFDFATDTAIVCSELVYKAYTATDADSSVPFGLVRTSGRWVLPPNDIVRQFDQVSDEERKLDFVLFLDGSERERRAYRRTEEEFRRSWQRPKWDFAQL